MAWAAARSYIKSGRPMDNCGGPRSFASINQAFAAEQRHSLTFLQLSDSHVWFDKAANPNAPEAIAKVK